MNKKKKYELLLDEYRELKNKIMDIDDSFYTAMYYDIRGYEWELYDENYDCLSDLRRQVEACRKLIEGLQSIKYIFG